MDIFWSCFFISRGYACSGWQPFLLSTAECSKAAKQALESRPWLAPCSDDTCAPNDCAQCSTRTNILTRFNALSLPEVLLETSFETLEGVCCHCRLLSFEQDGVQHCLWHRLAKLKEELKGLEEQKAAELQKKKGTRDMEMLGELNKDLDRVQTAITAMSSGELHFLVSFRAPSSWV